jgi:ATP-dependent Lon protease
MMHELRKTDGLEKIRQRFEVVDAAKSERGISGRDQRGVIKTLSGLMKIIYPDGNVTDPELEEVLSLSCELRQRVRDQLSRMAPGEYERVKISGRILKTGVVVTPKLPDADREQKVRLPEKPSVGEVIGLAVAGEHGVILLFEMQATKGSGRIVPLGSMQRVMRESIEAAAQYVKSNHKVLGIALEWRQNYDVAILATFMAVPKEGPSAGVTIVTGIVSALRGIPIRNDLAMTGEITIMGKVLEVGGIQEKIRVAVENGIKEVIIPEGNLKEAQLLPQSILSAVKITPVSSIEQVIETAFVSKEKGKGPIVEDND